MGFLTERERDILRWLREGLAVKDIGSRLGVSDTSVSRSISNIRVKAGDLAEDVEFLAGIGYLRVKGGRVEFLTRGRDPKALAGPARRRAR